MHRAIVITLGRALDEAGLQLQSEFEIRQRFGVLPEDLEAEFLLAPIEGVGNLSKPIELLREKLWEDIIQRLTGLLTFRSSGDAFYLDIILVTNFGEPLAAGATQVMVDAFLEVIPREFAALFPPNRDRSRRRWRIIPIALVPCRNDLKRDRESCIQDLASFHDQVQARHTASDDADFPVERLFILDGMSPQGILALQDLTIQSKQFVRLVLFSGLRTDTRMAKILEVRSSEIGATFGIAGASLDLQELQNQLSMRLVQASSDLLAIHDSADVASTSLVSGLAIEEEQQFEQTLKRIADLALNALTEEGSAAIGAVLRLYRGLPAQFDRVLEEHEWSQETPAKQKKGTTGVAAMGASTAGLSAGLFAVAYYAIGWTVIASAGLAAAFGAAAILIMAGLMFWSNRRTNQANEDATESSEPDEESVASKRTEALKGQVDHHLRQVVNLQSQLKKLNAGLATDAVLDEEEQEQSPSPFETDLGSGALHDSYYQVLASDEPAFVRRFIDQLGGWGAVLLAADLVDEDALLRAAREVFSDPMVSFENERAIREEVARSIDALLESFSGGIEPMLEYKSRRQFDPTGIRHDIENEFLVSASDLQKNVGRLTRMNGACSPIDAWIVSATTDIHRDAITIFNLE